MRALIPRRRVAVPNPYGLLHQRSGTEDILEPLLTLADRSDYLVAGSVGEVSFGDSLRHIPRFIFMGPKGGADTLRLAIFAAIQGDEPEGTSGLIAFLRSLETNPGLARGCHIYCYPICNPVGFAAGTKCNGEGQNLAAHFWRRSSQPEVYYLEREMGVHHFQGVISLHSGEHPGFLAQTSSSILMDALVRPALQAASKFLPGVLQEAARRTAWVEAVETGFLTRTDELVPTPFEINFSIPKLAPAPTVIHGTMSALQSIIESYRTLLALHQNI